jgi:hypothetical protein
MVEMDATISKLEYTLKDADISASPYLVQHITETIRLLRGVMEYKRKQWTKQEEEMGGCPCGCEDTVAKMTLGIRADSKSPHSSD